MVVGEAGEGAMRKDEGSNIQRIKVVWIKFTSHDFVYFNFPTHLWIRPVTVQYEGVEDEPVNIQTGKFGNNFMLRPISTATSIYSNCKCAP